MCEVHVIHDDADMLVWICGVCLVLNVLSEYPRIPTWHLIGQVENHVQIIDFDRPAFAAWVWNQLHRLVLMQLTFLIYRADGTEDRSMLHPEHVGNLVACHPDFLLWHGYPAAVRHCNNSSLHGYASVMLLNDALSLSLNAVRSVFSFSVVIFA